MGETRQLIYWSKLTYEGWHILAATSGKGLCFVGLHDQSEHDLAEWAKKTDPESLLVQDKAKLEPWMSQFVEFFRGERIHFSLPLDVRGTPFQLAVWDELCKIPYGETRSYTDLAIVLGKPSSPRAIGAAIGANPALLAVPCHRVVGKHGSLTGYREGLDRKAKLLQMEKEVLLNLDSGARLTSVIGEA